MTPEAVNAYFTPLDYVLYLVVVFVATAVYYQWRWSRICKRNIQTLVVRTHGGGDYGLAPLTGGYVALKSPGTDTTRLWPLSDLCTIEVPYPGVGFLPAFLQKSIRMVVLDETDWEPLTNRSPHRRNVASPDVVAFLRELAEDIDDQDLADRVRRTAEGMSSAPTREVIANPAVLGNLILERITAAVIMMNREMLEPINKLLQRLPPKSVTPQQFYIGIGVLLIAVVFLAYQLIPTVSIIKEMQESIDVISHSLGIAELGEPAGNLTGRP